MENALPAHLNLSLKRPILRPPAHCKYYYIDLDSRDWYRTASDKVSPKPTSFVYRISTPDLSAIKVHTVCGDRVF